MAATDAAVLRDPWEIEVARDRLVAAVGEGGAFRAFAVAANFEMMTRLADGTGARMPAERLERSAAAIGAMGVADITSRR